MHGGFEFMEKAVHEEAEARHQATVVHQNMWYGLLHILSKCVHRIFE